MKRILLLHVILVTGFLGRAQQDPQYNLYQFNQMIINPAYAGGRDAIAAIGATRKQWVGFDGAPQTTCFSIHSPIANKHLGVGLTVISDIMGPRNVTSAYGNVAYILKLGNHTKLSMGINAGYNRYQFNFSQIKFQQNEVVPAELLANQNRGALDINSGLYLRTTSFFLGVSATHLTAPDVYTYDPTVAGNGKYVYKLKTHLFVTAGKSFIIDNNLIFAPTILIKEVNSSYGTDFNLNFFLYKKIWLGAFYRYGYGPGGLLQYYVIPGKFRVAYSYDSGISDARRLGGSHEVMLGFDFSSNTGTRTKMANPRFL